MSKKVNPDFDGAGVSLEAQRKYANCRVYGHWWNSRSVEFFAATWEDHLVCENCGTERKDTIGKRERRVISRKYSYPWDYEYSRPKDRYQMRMDKMSKTGQLRAV